MMCSHKASDTHIRSVYSHEIRKLTHYIDLAQPHLPHTPEEPSRFTMVAVPLIKIPKKGQLPLVPDKTASATTSSASTTLFERPSLDGTLTISQMCDWHAEHSPEYPLFEYLDNDGQVASVKWKDVARAMHRNGWVIKEAVEEHMQPSLSPDGKYRRVIIAVLANSGVYRKNVPTTSVSHIIFTTQRPYHML